MGAAVQLTEQTFGFGAFVLELSTGENADNESAVAKPLERPVTRRTFEVSGGEIFRRGIAPIPHGRQPLVSDLGVGRPHLVVRSEVIKVDVDLNAAPFYVCPRSEADGRDDEGLAVSASSF